MSRVPVILQPAARQDYDDAYDWYDAQRIGLGDDFADEVEQALDRIAANPGQYGVVRGDVRMAVVRVFPYAVYYRELTGRVEVIAIQHTSRDPAVWQSRVPPPP